MILPVHLNKENRPAGGFFEIGIVLFP